jgi:myosin heavy subunit
MIKNRYLIVLVSCYILPVNALYGIDTEITDIMDSEHSTRSVAIDTKEDSSLLVNATYLLAQAKSAGKKNWKKWAQQGAMPAALVITIWYSFKMRAKAAAEQTLNAKLQADHATLKQQHEQLNLNNQSLASIVTNLQEDLKKKQENLTSNNQDLQKRSEENGSLKEENEKLKQEVEQLKRDAVDHAIPKPQTEAEARELALSAMFGQVQDSSRQTAAPSPTTQDQQGAGGIFGTAWAYVVGGNKE